MIANDLLKQLIIPEYNTGVYHKGGINTNGRTSIYDISHDDVKKVLLKNNVFSCLISDINVDKLSLKNPGQDKL